MSVAMDKNGLELLSSVCSGLLNYSHNSVDFSEAVSMLNLRTVTLDVSCERQFCSNRTEENTPSMPDDSDTETMVLRQIRSSAHVWSDTIHSLFKTEQDKRKMAQVSKSECTFFPSGLCRAFLELDFETDICALCFSHTDTHLFRWLIPTENLLFVFFCVCVFFFVAKVNQLQT